MKNRTKLWFLMIISVFVSFIIFISLSLLFGEMWDEGYNLRELKAISQETVDTIEQQRAFGKHEIQSILDQVHAEHPAIHLEWVDANGTSIYDTSGNMKNYNFQQLADRFLNMPENLWAEDEPISFASSTTNGKQKYYLLMDLPSEAMQHGQVYFYVRTTKVLFSLLGPLLLSFLVPYLLSIWYFSSMNRRINRLNNALNKVNIQSDVLVLKDNSKDEIGQLTQHYNSMVKRIQSQAIEIEQFENRRRQLLSNLSHDLRTPLTMILGYAETIRNGLYKDEKELQSSAKIILQRSRYMDRLLDQLLDITRQNSDTLTHSLAPHNLSEILRKIVADYLLFLDGQNYTLDINIADADIEAFIDVALIERAIRNLIDNAIRYGKDGYYLGISLEETQDEVWISVKDKGVGIALEEHERIFERFYRVNQGRQGEGLGIGLAFVKEIVELHHGKIQVTSVPFKETLFIIKLPKSREGSIHQ